MAFEATIALLGPTGFVATAAVLCALFAMLLAIGARGIPSALAKESKLDPLDAGASAPLARATGHVRAGPTHLGLGIDFEPFQAQMRHDFEALQAHIGRQCDLTFHDLGADFEAFQAKVGRRCDLELDALCARELDSMDSHSAKVMQDLEAEFGRGPAGDQAGLRPTGAGPEVELEADVELLCDRALDGACSHAFDAIDGALDCMCAAALKAMEDECGGFCAMDDGRRAGSRRAGDGGAAVLAGCT